MEEFKKTAKSFKGNTNFVLIDTDSDPNKRVMDIFGLKKDDVPTIRLISMEKNKPDFKEIKAEALIKFLESKVKMEEESVLKKNDKQSKDEL